MVDCSKVLLGSGEITKDALKTCNRVYLWESGVFRFRILITAMIMITVTLKTTTKINTPLMMTAVDSAMMVRKSYRLYTSV